MKIPFRFVVVDDDPINNMVCKYNIANLYPDAIIQLFTDPENALEWMKEEYSHSTGEPGTVLLLDINMPMMNGWEFLDEFGSFSDKVRAQIKIFIISSSIDPEDKQKAEDHSLVHGYYPKPLNKKTITHITSWK